MGFFNYYSESFFFFHQKLKNRFPQATPVTLILFVFLHLVPFLLAKVNSLHLNKRIIKKMFFGNKLKKTLKNTSLNFMRK